MKDQVALDGRYETKESTKLEWLQWNQTTDSIHQHIILQDITSVQQTRTLGYTLILVYISNISSAMCTCTNATNKSRQFVVIT